MVENLGKVGKTKNKVAVNRYQNYELTDDDDDDDTNVQVLYD